MTEDLLAGPNAVFSPSRIMFGAVLVLLAATMATVAIGSLVRRDRARFGPTTRRLCRGFGVGATDRKLLDSLAHGIGVPCASLLVSRGCFDAAAGRASQGEARQLTAIRRRLFG